MWASLFFGLPGFVSAQEADIYDDEAVDLDSIDGGDLEQKMPTTEELLNILDSMELPEEEKQNLLESIMKGFSEDGAEAGAEARIEPEKAFAAASNFNSQTLLLLAMLSLITLIFVFFGYKLYKSLSERERKREEKRKLKQMKKKK